MVRHLNGPVSLTIACWDGEGGYVDSRDRVQITAGADYAEALIRFVALPVWRQNEQNFILVTADSGDLID